MTKEIENDPFGKRLQTNTKKLMREDKTINIHEAITIELKKRKYFLDRKIDNFIDADNHQAAPDSD